MKPYYTDDQVTLHHGHDVDVLRTLPDASVNCVVTSPPYYGLRDYGQDGQRGLEASPQEYVAGLVEVFAEVWRVLADDGTAWLNLGDSYAVNGRFTYNNSPNANRDGSSDAGARAIADAIGEGINRRDGIPAKNLLGIPWRVAFALQDDGWWLRNAICWAKPNAMPESVTDRLSSRYELVFLLTKSARYWFDLDAVREPAVTTSPAALNWARDTKEADVPGQSARQHRTDRAQGKPAGTNLVPNGARHTNGHEQGRNPGDVWNIPTVPFSGAHYAVMAPAVAERCIRAGCKPGGVVLDPYSGTGTTGMVALRNGRRYIGIDLNEKDLADSLRTRLAQGALIPDGEGDAA